MSDQSCQRAVLTPTHGLIVSQSGSLFPSVTDLERGSQLFLTASVSKRTGCMYQRFVAKALL